MPKKRTTVYYSEEVSKWLKLYPAADTTGGSLNIILDWATNSLMFAQKRVFASLDEDDRKALVMACFNTFWPEYRNPSLDLLVNDWFEIAEGALLEWQKEKVAALVSKLASLNPIENFAIALWAKGYTQVHEGMEIEQSCKIIPGTKDTAPVAERQ